MLSALRWKVAGQSQLEPACYPRLDLGHALGVQLGLVGVAVAGVRRAGDGCDAFGDGYFCHGDGGFEVG
jgi:hypothetical protein